jgi:hypothetical protein
MTAARRVSVRLPAMSLLGSAWSALARGRRKLRNRFSEPPEFDREAWVREVAPGRSFVDVGGLFALAGEIAFTAEEAGATEVSLFDSGDSDLIEEGADHPSFDQKKEARGSKVRFVQGDLEDPESMKRLGPHDVVYCSGVLYHSPAPMRQLIALREVTRELLFLSTVTIPEIPGIPQACVFLPHMPEGVRHAYARGLRYPHGMLAVGPPWDDRPMYGHGNCWFGITPSALHSMLEVARFEVVEDVSGPQFPFHVSLICRPIDKHPSLPPLDYARLRGDERAKGVRLPFATWYDEVSQARS